MTSIEQGQFCDFQRLLAGFVGLDLGKLYAELFYDIGSRVFEDT